VEGPSEEDEVQLDSSLDDVEDATKLLSPKKSVEDNAEGRIAYNEAILTLIFIYCRQRK